MLALTGPCLYARLTISEANPDLQRVAAPVRQRRQLRWAWLVEGVGALVRRPDRTRPAGDRAALAGGRVDPFSTVAARRATARRHCDRSARRRGRRAGGRAAVSRLPRTDGRAALTRAFGSGTTKALEQRWREHLPSLRRRTRGSRRRSWWECGEWLGVADDGRGMSRCGASVIPARGVRRVQTPPQPANAASGALKRTVSARQQVQQRQHYHAERKRRQQPRQQPGRDVVARTGARSSITAAASSVSRATSTPDGGHHHVARAGGEHVGHIEPGGPPQQARHPLFEQQRLDEFALGLIVRPRDLRQPTLGQLRLDQARTPAALGDQARGSRRRRAAARSRGRNGRRRPRSRRIQGIRAVLRAGV